MRGGWKGFIVYVCNLCLKLTFWCKMVFLTVSQSSDVFWRSSNFHLLSKSCNWSALLKRDISRKLSVSLDPGKSWSMLLRSLLILCLGAQVTLGLLGPEPWSMIDRGADTLFDRYVRTPPRNYVRVIKNGIRDTGRVRLITHGFHLSCNYLYSAIVYMPKSNETP